MEIITFKEKTVTYAENQPEYKPLPAYEHNDQCGTITCCWKLGRSERLKLLFTGKVWHNILTFRQPLQPQLLSVHKPEMK